jgi:adenylate cyclase
MHRKLSLPIKEWLFVIVAWLILFYFYYFISYWGAQDFIKKGLIRDYLFSWQVHIEISTQAILFGILYNLVDYIFDRSRLSRSTFGKIILFKSVFYSLSIVLAGFIVFLLFYTFSLKPIEEIERMTQLITLPYIISMTIYITGSILLLNFLSQVNRKFGPGNMLKFIMGRYHSPREEKRIFLFLDLKDSTKIAEELGNHQYSRLLQNCYQDLTDIIVKYEADVYQYVGDEVVLSWPVEKGLKNMNCIKFYFAYKLKLESRREFYKKNFNTMPVFRGGMDMGRVTVAEVGEIKRDIAYHGDVLNTASRIQGKCKDFNQQLLVSDHIAKSIKKWEGFDLESIEQVELRGKKQCLNIHAVNLI